MTAHATRPAERKRASALEAAGLTPQRAVHWNLGPPELYEHAVRRAEGVIAEGGAFAAVTAPHTGRSPNDKFIVREPASADEMWWNRGNQPLEADAFERLKASLLAHLAEQELFVRDLFAGADAEHRFGLRFVTPNADGPPLWRPRASRRSAPCIGTSGHPSSTSTRCVAPRV